MANCGGSGTCVCQLEAGLGMTVTGTGTPQDPFVLSSDQNFTVVDNTTFDLTLTGTGAPATPWALEVNYAATARLNDLPDVTALAPTNTQVLGWDSTLSQWTPRAATTAASGSVTHDTSMTGDGSGGTPLQILEDPAGFLVTNVAGLALTTAAQNQMIRKYVDAAARTASLPAPTLNTLSMLDTVPGMIDYWNGSAWTPVPGQTTDDMTGQFMALSGAYVSGMRLKRLVRQVSTTTDAAGIFDVLTAADLGASAGVVTVNFQETGTLSWKAVLFPNTTKVSATAFRLLDGAVYPSQLVTGTVIAWCY